MKLLEIMPIDVKDKLQEKIYDPGDTILYSEQDNYYIYFLVEGKAEAHVLNEAGDFANIFMYEENSLFGEVEQFWDGKKPVEITALTTCKVLRLHRNDLYFWMQSDFNVTKQLIQIMASKLVANSERIAEAQLLTVKERLLRCIATHLKLGDLNTLSKDQVVKEAGAPLRSINRAIAECNRQGILCYSHKQFKILDETAVSLYAR